LYPIHVFICLLAFYGRLLFAHFRDCSSLQDPRLMKLRVEFCLDATVIQCACEFRITNNKINAINPLPCVQWLMAYVPPATNTDTFINYFDFLVINRAYTSPNSLLLLRSYLIDWLFTVFSFWYYSALSKKIVSILSDTCQILIYALLAVFGQKFQRYSHFYYFSLNPLVLAKKIASWLFKFPRPLCSFIF